MQSVILSSRSHRFETTASIAFTNDEFEHIHNVVLALQVVKLTVEVLCRRDSNLLTADVALRFMLKKLRAQNSVLGRAY